MTKTPKLSRLITETTIDIPPTAKRLTLPEEKPKPDRWRPQGINPYTAAHQKHRAILLQRYPICQRCGKAASEEKHHIDQNAHNHADDNCLMLCKPCHDQISREMRARKN